MKKKAIAAATLALGAAAGGYFLNENPTKEEAAVYCKARGMDVHAISEETWACLDGETTVFIPKSNELPVRGRPK